MNKYYNFLCITFNSLSPAWVWWFTATKTVRRTWQRGSTTLSLPWSSRGHSPHGAGPWWSRWPCTSSTAAVSVLSSGSEDASTYWVLGTLLINDFNWVVNLYEQLNKFISVYCLTNDTNLLTLQYEAGAKNIDLLGITLKFCRISCHFLKYPVVHLISWTSLKKIKL